MKKIEAHQFDDLDLQAEFAGVATEMLTNLDYPIDPESVVTLGVYGNLTTYAHSPDAQAYCSVATYLPPVAYQGDGRLYTHPREVPHTYNGLLLDRMGNLETPREAFPRWGTLSVMIDSSPEGHNQATRQLGYTPGVDAMEVIKAGVGLSPVGEQTANWAQRKVVTSGLGSPQNTAHHDVNARGHAGAPRTLDTITVDLSVREAERLVTRPGLISKIDNPLGQGAKEFENFCNGIEDLPLTTVPLVEAVWHASCDPNLIPAINRKIRRMAAKPGEVTQATFGKLGIVPLEASTEERQRQVGRTLQRTVLNITKMILTAEEIHPTPGLLHVKHRLRKRNLGKIATEFAKD